MLSHRDSERGSFTLSSTDATSPTVTGRPLGLAHDHLREIRHLGDSSERAQHLLGHALLNAAAGILDVIAYEPQRLSARQRSAALVLHCRRIGSGRGLFELIAEDFRQPLGW